MKNPTYFKVKIIQHTKVGKTILVRRTEHDSAYFECKTGESILKKDCIVLRQYVAKICKDIITILEDHGVPLSKITIHKKSKSLWNSSNYSHVPISEWVQCLLLLYKQGKIVKVGNKEDLDHGTWRLSTYEEKLYFKTVANYVLN